MIRIAVVEDEDKWANLIKEYLDRFSSQESLDIAITRFCDGYELVEKYAHDYSIIFMDIEMGLMNGMEAAEEIRKTDDIAYVESQGHRLFFYAECEQYETTTTL